MATFKEQAQKIIENLELKGKGTLTFAELEKQILEATQQIGKVAAQTLETKDLEGISPLGSQMPELPSKDAQK